MTKDNILFGIVGLLAGLIIGFFVTNSLNKQQGFGALAAQPPAPQSGTLPPGHPDVPPGGNAGDQPSNGANAPEVQAAITKAKAEPDNFDAQIKAAQFYY